MTVATPNRRQSRRPPPFLLSHLDGFVRFGQRLFHVLHEYSPFAHQVVVLQQPHQTLAVTDVKLWPEGKLASLIGLLYSYLGIVHQSLE